MIRKKNWPAALMLSVALHAAAVLLWDSLADKPKAARPGKGIRVELRRIGSSGSSGNTAVQEGREGAAGEGLSAPTVKIPPAPAASKRPSAPAPIPAQKKAQTQAPAKVQTKAPTKAPAKVQEKVAPIPKQETQPSRLPTEKGNETVLNANIEADAAHGGGAGTAGQGEKGTGEKGTKTASGEGGGGGGDSQGKSGIAGVVDIADLHVVRSVKPEYPAIARKRREEGTVVLLISLDGKNITDVKVEKSSGSSALDHSAVAAVRRWRFENAGRIQVRVPVTFRLGS